MEENKSSIKSNLLEFFQSVAIAIGICVFVYIFLATPNQIEGLSMDPTFKNGEIVLTSKVHEWLGGTQLGASLGLNYKRGDVVVFQKPGFSDFIKRVIALPYDKIQIKDGNVFVNDTQLNESYLPNGTYTVGGSFLEDNGDPKTLGENEYFLMGDNRANSHDSRYIDIAFVKREWIKGKVIVRYWPLNSIWIVQHPEL